MTNENISVVITATPVIIAAFTFIFGINAWRREFIGRRRIKLAEGTLALFYEAQAAIRAIRNPFGYVGEGTNRKRSEKESEEEPTILSIINERYEKTEKIFSKLRSKKCRFMATFRPDTADSFDEMNRIINEIFSACRNIATCYKNKSKCSDPDQVDKYDNKIEKMDDIVHQYESDDEISRRVQTAIDKIEKIVQQESSKNRKSFFRFLSLS